MKSLTFVAASAALISFASARVCQNLTIPLIIRARNAVFDVDVDIDNIGVTNLALEFARPGVNITDVLLKGYATLEGNIRIAATYCEPDSGKPDVVQVLTHGIGFDRSYWDFPFNNFNFSYVKQAVDEEGYATLAYDRLGIGQSTIGEPVNQIQAPLQIAALKEITHRLRDGKLPGLKGKRFDKVIHAGHSFGSAQTFALVAADPEISDGIVLTGFSPDLQFLALFALSTNLIQAKDVPALAKLPPGYFVPGLVAGLHTNFFAPGEFDPELLKFAAANGQPVTLGEILTFGGLVANVVNEFRGPVLVITGERDIPFCGGECVTTAGDAESIPAKANATLPNASKFEAVIVPRANHALNLQFTAPDAYRAIFDFLQQNGLKP